MGNFANLIIQVDSQERINIADHPLWILRQVFKQVDTNLTGVEQIVAAAKLLLSAATDNESTLLKSRCREAARVSIYIQPA
jgi:hypothetical protein